MDDQETSRWINDALANGAKMLPESVRVVAEVFCGCGDSNAAWEWIKEYLSHPDRGHPETGDGYLAIYLMHHLGMTEHGVSVAFSWLTPKGEELLAFLAENGCNWDDHKKNQEWIDSRGCSWGLA